MKSLSEEALSEKFFAAGAVQCGQFTLKSGLSSPIYLDMRSAICNPLLLREIISHLQRKIEGIDFDLICGVPYSAIPLATALSLATDKPLLLRRKEAKGYGLKKILEGSYKEGQKVLVLEDIVTTGESVIETIDDLEKAGLEVLDVAVLVNRDQGGRENLLKRGITLHSLFTLGALVETLSKKSLVEPGKIEEVRAYLKMHERAT